MKFLAPVFFAASALANGSNGVHHPADSMLPLKSYASKAGATNQVFSAYIVNWAHYRAAPYTYTMDSFAPIASKVDVALYSFVYFCPPAGTSPMPYWSKYPYGQCSSDSEYSLLSIDPKDPAYIAQVVAMGPKVVFSVGGWNFPSEYFSKMVATSESRGKFVKSVKSWMDKYDAHGVDLDWEYPCSGPRSDAVKISCDKFQTVEDKGGSCPEDNDNLLELVKDLRSGLGPDAIVTIASQAGVAHAVNENLAAVTPYIDAWHVMSYDYAVSDITGSESYTSPNAPLYTPVSAPNAVQMSVNDSMVFYLQSGVPANKLMVGLPLYAHTWYVPGLTGVDQWGKFGLDSTIQGLCCGPFAQTYGAQAGAGCLLCGSMMYSEIMAADCPTTWDEETRSDIAYCEQDGYDGGYTKAGTWMSYNSITSAKEFIQWEMSMGFAGIFVYSTDMDTVSADGTYDYKYMNAMADEIAGGPKAPTPPTPQPAPTPRPPSPPTPGPPVCGTWSEVCNGCKTCSECPTAPAQWYCEDAGLALA